MYISQIFLTKFREFSLDISLLWSSSVFVKNKSKFILDCPSKIFIFLLPPISIQSLKFVPLCIDFYPAKVCPQCVCPKTDALLTFHNFHNYLSSCLSNIQLRVTSNLLQHFVSCYLINFSPRSELHHPWFGIQLWYIGWRESLRRAAAHHCHNNKKKWKSPKKLAD